MRQTWGPSAAPLLTQRAQTHSHGLTQQNQCFHSHPSISLPGHSQATGKCSGVSTGPAGSGVQAGPQGSARTRNTSSFTQEGTQNNTGLFLVPASFPVPSHLTFSRNLSEATSGTTHLLRFFPRSPHQFEENASILCTKTLRPNVNSVISNYDAANCTYCNYFCLMCCVINKRKMQIKSLNKSEVTQCSFNITI